MEFDSGVYVFTSSPANVTSIPTVFVSPNHLSVAIAPLNTFALFIVAVVLFLFVCLSKHIVHHLTSAARLSKFCLDSHIMKK